MAHDGAASGRVLVLAPIGRDGPAAAALLRETGLAAEVCAGLEALRNGLEAGAGVAVVAEEAFYREPIELLIGWVDAQPSWSDFPFVVLTSGRDASPDHLRRLRLLEALRNVSLLERPVQTVTLVSAVQAALRARRRQYEMRGHLRERERTAARLDALVAERTRELDEANRRLRAEIAEREQAEAALRQAQKMEAIGQLTGGVAHDFNNLLTAVLGNLELAALQATSEALRRLLGNAERAARRGAKLTEQLLAFSRKQRLNLEPTDLNALVSSIGDLLFRTIGGAVRIETVLEKDLWPAMVDASQLELVILNLAINGRDAMPEGGRLTVTTANIGAGDPRRPAELAPGDYVAVSVSDTGTGMTTEVLAKAFEPFYTTKDVGRGTGLGLSQTYGVARQSGGTVRVDTKLGRGTTVTVYLPRATAGAAATPIEAAAGPQGLRRDGVVLVVDDDPDVRELTVALLESLGYAVTAAESGRAALEILERGARVDLMLIDYAMPEFNGVETVRLVRAQRPELPILLMTGYADTGALEGEAGRDGILKKPFTLAELAARIEDAMAGTKPARASSSSTVVPIRPLPRGR
jgi:signal transduction histidine kinase/CheY-like chemotaxis protein